MTTRMKIDCEALEIGDIVTVTGLVCGNYPEGGTCLIRTAERFPCRIDRMWEDDEIGWRFVGEPTTAEGLAILHGETRNPAQNTIYFGEAELVAEQPYPLVDDMFAVPEYQKTGVLYVVRTKGWNKRDTDNYWVCEGGLAGRPHSGPFKTAAEAEAIVATRS